MAVPEVVVEGVVFPSVARPPGSAGSHFLGGAGALRCVEVPFHLRASLSLVGGGEYGTSASG